VTVQPVLPPVPAEPAGLPGAPTPEGFRAACAQFATGVVAVTASADGRTFGSTVNSFTSLTLDPPQVLVCLARTSTTWSAIERSGAFAVNVLAADQVPVARLLASKEPDKMARIGTRPGTRGLPLIQGALSWFECSLSEAVPSGTHLVLIGSVLRVRSCAGKAPALFFRSELLPGLPAGGPAPVAR
jgi:3-hydroxy-9,10-secoandrosta-1,3,5(10)-triene-9,17-dione monooxygenase reductase component